MDLTDGKLTPNSKSFYAYNKTPGHRYLLYKEQCIQYFKRLKAVIKMMVKFKKSINKIK